MIIEYKKQTALTQYIQSQTKCTKFTTGGLFEKLGFKSVKYPDIYIHTGAINSYAKLMLENSKISIVNSSILQNELQNSLNMPTASIEVILPINDVEKYKKYEVKKPFYDKYDIDEEFKIVYFCAKDLKRNGFESFCDIVSKIESTNYKAVVTCNIDKELVYAKQVLKNFNLEENILIVEDEIFDVADIYIQPTINKNFSLNIIKAITNKCVAFIPETNYAIEVLDIFAIMDSPKDSNTAYKIDMLLRVPDELKKIRKENFTIGKTLNTKYMNKKIDNILKKLEKLSDK
jgi:hypothetical protein